MSNQIKNLDQYVAVPHYCIPNTVQYRIELPRGYTLSILAQGEDNYECAVFDKDRNFIELSRLGLIGKDGLDPLVLLENERQVSDLIDHLQKHLK